MKELTIEEKAKRYDEAIKKVNDYYEGKTKLYSDVDKTLNYLFPELKESEDEKIRKSILELVKQSSEILNKSNQNRMLAWLEKQGENISLPKFTFDDVLALQCCMETVKKVQEDKELYEQLQSLHDRLHDAYWLEKQGEPIDINPSEFDLRLNKLLKQFETLPKEELASSLSFYLNVVQNNGTYKAEEKQGEQNLANSAKTCKEEQKPTEEYNITGIGSKNAQGKLGEMIRSTNLI